MSGWKGFAVIRSSRIRLAARWALLTNVPALAPPSVIALSKLYSLGDHRLAQIQVRGDLVVPDSNQIMTRSRTKQRTSDFHDFLLPTYLLSPLNSALPSRPPADTVLPSWQADPDQYTIVPAQLKIVKVLVEELISASGVGGAMNPASAAAATGLGGGGDRTTDDAELSDSDSGWEDYPNDTLDLALGSTIKDLMRTDSVGGGSRQRDDETQAYLVEFFTRAAKDNLASFTDVWFPRLSDEEKRKLQEAASGQR